MEQREKSLLSMTAEIAALEQAILANEGELTPELEQMFDLTSGDLKIKIDRYKYMMDAFEWRAAQFKSMKDQAAAAQKTFENLREHLKDNIKFCAAKLNTDDLMGVDWRFKVTNNKPKVEILDKYAIPEKFMKEKVELVPDREAIECALLLGEVVVGAELGESRTVRAYVNKEPKQVKEAKK